MPRTDICCIVSSVQDGIAIYANGIIFNFHGTVLLTLADTLAAHQLGRYKVGVGFALRKCRACMATGDDIQKKVHQCAFSWEGGYYKYMYTTRS